MLLTRAWVGFGSSIAAALAVATGVVACESDATPAPVADAGGLLDGGAPPPTGVPDAANIDDGGPEAGTGSAVVQIAMGRYHGCARLASGAVSCWGNNNFGALGNGQKTPDGVLNLPQKVTGLEDAVQISAGEHHSCAVRATGGVVCWGFNGFGILGDGTTTERLVPTPVVGSDAGASLTGAAAVDTQWVSSCIRHTAGTISCWGEDNTLGRNGDGTNAPRRIPSVDVVGLTDAVELAKAESHACARRATGQVVCWGANGAGNFGNGTAGGTSNVPLNADVADAILLGVGQNQTCALRAAGGVHCWGVNNAGQLGDGTKTHRPSPTPVSGLTDAKQLAGGASHFCALHSSGAVSCWGSNTYGQIGDGTPDERLTPTPVTGLTDAVEISAGWLFTCARRAAGGIVCWGANDRGQHGDGTVTEHRTPSPVIGL